MATEHNHPPSPICPKNCPNYKAPPPEPPDEEVCQAMIPTGHSFMTLGGNPYARRRCTNRPSVIATENKPGSDGFIGSMSLCAECLTVFKRQMPEDFATIKNIEEKN